MSYEPTIEHVCLYWPCGSSALHHEHKGEDGAKIA